MMSSTGSIEIRGASDSASLHLLNNKYILSHLLTLTFMHHSSFPCALFWVIACYHVCQDSDTDCVSGFNSEYHARSL